MKYKTLYLPFFQCIFGLTLLLLFGVSTLYAQEPEIRKGVLDLSNYSFEKDGPIKLDGNWEFYWQQVLTPEDFYDPASQPTDPLYIPVPGKWSGGVVPQAPKDGYGYGSYRLIVLLPKDYPEDMGLKIGFIGTAARFYINKKLVYEAGKVGTSLENSKPEWRPTAITFQPQVPTVELVLQVSNYRDLTSGVIDSLYLGSASQAFELRLNRLLYDMFLFGAMIIMVLYHLGLYYFRRSDASPLFFALFTLSLALRIIVYEELFILKVFPDLEWVVLAKTGYLTFSLAVLFFFHFINEVFKQHIWRYAPHVVDAGSLLYSLIVIVTPSRFYMHQLYLFQFFTIAVALYVFYVLYQAFRNRRPGAGLFIVGFALMFITVIHDMIKSFLVLPTIFLVPFGMLIFVLFQSMVMTKKFADAFQQSEHMAEHLWHLNQSMERFVPREFLKFLKKDNVMEIQLGDHASHRMTVLFADIRDFTSLSEKLTPEENFRFINSFLNRMGPIIRDHHGFVDKYMGDGIMALFPEHAEDAVEAAIHLREELVRYNKDRAKMNYQPINFGVGLHTGDLMLGTVGENLRMDGTVISDAVNLASRLEALTKKLGVGIAISEATQACLKTPDNYQISYIGKERVKGKSKEILIFEVAGRRQDND